jgi:vesicle coat complex subunit
MIWLWIYCESLPGKWFCLTSSPDIDVRKKAVSIALDIISSRNVKEVVAFLKKELLKTLENEYDNVITIDIKF